MRLSEQIVLGSTLMLRGDYLSHDQSVGCVLQMALAAAGEPKRMAACTDAGFKWPWIKTLRTTCPACGNTNIPGDEIIAIHLNDLHQWPIDHIAQWVASVEPTETAEEKTIAESAPSLETEQEFDKEVLRHLGLPEDYVPADENEAYRLIIAALED